MKDFHHTPEPELPDTNDFMLAAIIGVGCLGMLTAGIVVGAFVSGTFSAGLYGALLLVQFVVTQGCIMVFREHTRRWLKFLEMLP